MESGSDSVLDLGKRGEVMTKVWGGGTKEKKTSISKVSIGHLHR